MRWGENSARQRLDNQLVVHHMDHADGLAVHCPHQRGFALNPQVNLTLHRRK